MATTNILRKRLILNQPKSGDVSQYTFAPEEADFDYENSTSLPKNNDKFQSKDLNITTIGSELNEKIIARNLKSEGSSFLRIDKCFVEYVGTSTPLKEVRVKMWMMSDKFVQDNDADDIGLNSASELLELVNVTDNNLADRIFEYEAGRLGNGDDLGNLSFIEGVNILSNLSGSIDNIVEDDFSNKTEEYAVEEMLLRYDEDLVDADGNPTNLITTIFDETRFNPIYMIFELTAHVDPEDDRDSRWQVFKIDNLELFEERNGVRVGKQRTFTFDEMFQLEDDASESNGGIEDSALKITDFQVTINTQAQPPNAWNDGSDEKMYRDFFQVTKPVIEFNKSFHQNSTDKTTFLKISPENQLDNFEPPGPEYQFDGGPPDGFTGNLEYGLFPDYFPKQHIGILDTTTDELVNDVYLDEYRDDMDEQIIAIASSPALVSFDFEMTYITGSGNYSNYNESMTRLLPANSGHHPNISNDYYYFVINWDDKDNEIKSLEEWLKIRPTTYRELLELQNNNLYSVVRHKQTTSNYVDYTINTYGKRLSNTYTTPGIKTIKTIMFSYDEPSNQVGRWKLLTSRFYLDIPLNQYPDFGDVGGADYTTLPWPFTTAIIGGVSEDSKYKKSVQDALSGGNIGDTDIIDERLLINDLENDELGKNIQSMDLEQLRYFNKPYGINDLLLLSYIEELVGEPVYIVTEEHLKTLPGYFGGNVIDGDPIMTINELSWSPVGESNPAFGESGYLLTIFTYDELRDLWINNGDTILQAMNDYIDYDLDTSNWIFNEEDLDTFVYNGFIIAETGLFVNNMALAIYRMKVGLFPVIPDYFLNEEDVTQWNDIGRPDIAQFVQSVLDDAPEGGNAPPTIEEDGNQTFNGPGDGGGIDEGGIDGSEPHFQGGVPGGGGSPPDNPGDTGDDDFPPTLPQLNLESPSSPSVTFETNEEITIEWKELNDRILNNYSDEYGPPGTSTAFYYSQQKFPSVWQNVNITLVNSNINNTGLSDIFVGNVGLGEGEDLNAQLSGAHRRITFTIPTAEEMGLNISTDEAVSEYYRLKLIVSDGQDTIESQSTMQHLIRFRMVGGDAPPVGLRPKKYFENPTFVELESSLPIRYNQLNADGSPFWDGINHKYSEKTSVGQIFISDNQDRDLKQSCKLELNTGNLTDNSIYDSSGNSNKGVLIGDYKVKKDRKGVDMKRDSFVKFPKKTNNVNGAL